MSLTHERGDASVPAAITLALPPEEIRERLIATCQELRDAGMSIVFDSNDRRSLWDAFLMICQTGSHDLQHSAAPAD